MLEKKRVFESLKRFYQLEVGDFSFSVSSSYELSVFVSASYILENTKLFMVQVK